MVGSLENIRTSNLGRVLIKMLNKSPNQMIEQMHKTYAIWDLLALM